jgi:hypothetical protein
MQFATGCDRKQVKSRLIEHLRRERENDEEWPKPDTQMFFKKSDIR